MKTRMLFTPYDEFYYLGIFSFCYVCNLFSNFIYVFVRSCEMFLSFGIIQCLKTPTWPGTRVCLMWEFGFLWV